MPIELIAEVASNHGGSVPLAKEFIKRFAGAGADWVKFQTTRVKHLDPADLQYAWFQRAELSDDAHFELKACCDAEGVKMLTTVYHHADVPFVASLGLEAIKIGSGEANDCDLAAAVGAKFPRIVVASGLSSPFAGVVKARWVMAEWLFCKTRYPCPPTAARGAVPYCGYGYAGWSDHCVGLDGARLAIMDGARIIEKHVCLPQQARPVRSWEASVEEFADLRHWADDDPQRFLGRWQYT